MKTEDGPLDPSPPQELRGTLDAIRYLEHAVTTTPGIAGVALRYGVFYGPGTGVFDPSLIEQICKRRMPLIGGGTAWWSFLHIEDAAEATAVAVEHGEGIYNLIDDDPVPVGGSPNLQQCSAQSRRSVYPDVLVGWRGVLLYKTHGFETWERQAGEFESWSILRSTTT